MTTCTCFNMHPDPECGVHALRGDTVTVRVFGDTGRGETKLAVGPMRLIDGSLTDVERWAIRKVATGRRRCVLCNRRSAQDVCQ